MGALVPAGLLPLHAALGKVAEAWLPEGWEGLSGENLEFFDAASDRDWSRARWTRAYPVGTDAFHRLRPLAAAGSLPMLMRMPDGGPALVAPDAWLSRSADSLDKILGGTVRLKLADGESTAGPILVRVADLDAVLRGEVAPSLRAAPPTADVAPAPPSALARKRAGRPTNPEGDAFWIEVCRRMMAGASQGEPAKLTADMAQWCADTMAAPYDGETVRKKLGRLFGALGSG